MLWDVLAVRYRKHHFMAIRRWYKYYIIMGQRAPGSALENASRHGHKDVAQMLLDHGANVKKTPRQLH